MTTEQATRDELDHAMRQVEDLAYCGDGLASLLDEIGRTVSLSAHTREVLIRRLEAWRSATGTRA